MENEVKNRRADRITVYFDDADKETVRAAARHVGMNMSQYLRWAALAKAREAQEQAK
ncbi:MAG: hypothetical protein GOVbin7368_6 [Prokaryotic dsDNA virus sp.]|nr:MAG: hypothetical protein GOVbin7368_6 [Prokaryotic dsDNA virus sp.]